MCMFYLKTLLNRFLDHNKKPRKFCSYRAKPLKVMLPDLDSNQDKQNQNLRYYRYTIGQ